MCTRRHRGYAYDYPQAYRMFENEITLPLNTRMELDDVDYVCEVFHECYGALVAEGIS